MSGKSAGRHVGRMRRQAARAEGGQESLANALRFEREKTKVLLDEVIDLEDALVNRQMTEFDAVISDETRDFWREQLLANREKAEVALAELAGAKAEAKAEGGRVKDEGGTRRPLHNRATARPVPPGTEGGRASSTPGPADGRAVKIRNRAHELRKTEGIPFSAAFRRAEREILEEGSA